MPQSRLAPKSPTTQNPNRSLFVPQMCGGHACQQTSILFVLVNTPPSIYSFGTVAKALHRLCLTILGISFAVVRWLCHGAHKSTPNKLRITFLQNSFAGIFSCKIQMQETFSRHNESKAGMPRKRCFDWIKMPCTRDVMDPVKKWVNWFVQNTCRL